MANKQTLSNYGLRQGVLIQGGQQKKIEETGWCVSRTITDDNEQEEAEQHGSDRAARVLLAGGERDVAALGDVLRVLLIAQADLGGDLLTVGGCVSWGRRSEWCKCWRVEAAADPGRTCGTRAIIPGKQKKKEMRTGGGSERGCSARAQIRRGGRAARGGHAEAPPTAERERDTAGRERGGQTYGMMDDEEIDTKQEIHQYGYSTVYSCDERTADTRFLFFFFLYSTQQYCGTPTYLV